MSSNLPSAPKPMAIPQNSAPPPSLLSGILPGQSKKADDASADDIDRHKTLLVIEFDIDVKSRAKSHKQGRAEAEGEIRAGFKKLADSLSTVRGLNWTIRECPIDAGDKDKKAVPKSLYFLLTLTAEGVADLVQAQRGEDFIHGVPKPSASPLEAEGELPGGKTRWEAGEVSEGEVIRLLAEKLEGATVQSGLGITPGEGEWARVTQIIALHDEAFNREWVQGWLSQGWYVGLAFGKDDKDRIREQFGPDIALYFSFLSFYTRALVPIAIIGIVFFLGSWGAWARLANLVGLSTWANTGGPAAWGHGWEWNWTYGLILSVWSVLVVETWKIHERRLSVAFGTHRASRYEHFRTQYVDHLLNRDPTTRHALHDRFHNTSASLTLGREANVVAREIKTIVNIPFVLVSALALAVLLTGVFLFEAFIAHLYDGPGKKVITFLPTVVFVGVVPNLISLYHSVSLALVEWEMHATKASYEKSLTVKTFAMNAVVAYSGLFLSAYVYAPFGEHVMGFFSSSLTQKQNKIPIASAEKSGMHAGATIAGRARAKNQRLVNQVFAYTVTNQVINAFQEIGMPYIMERYQQWRSGDAAKNAKQSRSSDALASHNPQEDRLISKIHREMGLPAYTLFGDYAEMVTQFGYVSAWAIVWPLAPLCALVNNYFELRSDAIKICSHVQRPIGERVESIGPWVTMMTFISWLAFVTNATLIYLFKPSLNNPLTGQTINPELVNGSMNTFGSRFLHSAFERATYGPVNTTSAYETTVPFWIANSVVAKSVLPMAIPTLLIALLASHAWFIVRSVAQFALERTMWISSDEALGLEAGEQVARHRYLQNRAKMGDAQTDPVVFKGALEPGQDSSFWTTDVDSARQRIEGVLKSE